MCESQSTWRMATARRAKPWASLLPDTCPIQPTWWGLNLGRQQIVDRLFQLAVTAVWSVVVRVWQPVAQPATHSGVSRRNQAGANGARRDVVSLTWTQMDTIIQAATKNGNNGAPTLAREEREHHPAHVKWFLIMGLWCQCSHLLWECVVLSLKSIAICGKQCI